MSAKLYMDFEAGIESMVEAKIAHPSTENEIIAFVKNANNCNGKIKVVGAMHSNAATWLPDNVSSAGTPVV